MRCVTLRRAPRARPGRVRWLPRCVRTDGRVKLYAKMGALPNGFLLRRDFVALPIDFLSFVALSGVDDDLLLATSGVDHSAAAVLITIPFSKNFDVAWPSRFAFNREGLKDPESVALVRSQLAV